jgi:hypothetical protein
MVSLPVKSKGEDATSRFAHSQSTVDGRSRPGYCQRRSQVKGPTTPSGTRCWARCSSMTASRVCGPKTPSARTPDAPSRRNRSCTTRTASPRLPNRSGGPGKGGAGSSGTTRSAPGPGGRGGPSGAPGGGGGQGWFTVGSEGRRRGGRGPLTGGWGMEIPSETGFTLEIGLGKRDIVPSWNVRPRTYDVPCSLFRFVFQTMVADRQDS